MKKQTLQKVIFIGFKLIILLLLTMEFFEDYLTVQNNVGEVILYAYTFVMSVCFLCLGFAFFFKSQYKYILYIVFGIFGMEFIAMNNLVSDIYDARMNAWCLQNGQVYNYDKHQCDGIDKT